MTLGLSLYLGQMARTLMSFQFNANFRGVQRMNIRSYSHSKLFMMPEGPEVASLSDDLQLRYGNGWTITNVEFLSGRYSYPGAHPTGTKEFMERLPLNIENIQCKGKFIYFSLDRNISIWNTLGLTGGWVLNTSPYTHHLHTHARVAFTVVNNDKHPPRMERLYFYDQRNFGTLKFCFDPLELQKKISSLGPCWLKNPHSMASFMETARKTKETRPLAVFLMDQKKSAGIGNYALAEVLYKAKIYPFVTCGEITDEDWQNIYYAIIQVLTLSYKSQSPLMSNMESMDFKFSVYAQKRDPLGHEVIREDGPHKRTIHWVREVQTKYAPTS